MGFLQKLFKRQWPRLEEVQLHADRPDLEPGAKVVMMTTPPGLDEFGVSWVGVRGEVIWNDHFAETSEWELVSVRVMVDECPLKLIEGAEFVDLYMPVGYLKVEGGR